MEQLPLFSQTSVPEISTTEQIFVDLVSESWYRKIKYVFPTFAFTRLIHKVARAREIGTVYPEINEVFRAYQITPFESIKVIILGQSVYSDGNGDGLIKMWFRFCIIIRLKFCKMIKTITSNITCTKCGIEKAPISFRKQPTYTSRMCIDCQELYGRNWRKAKTFVKLGRPEREDLFKLGKNRCTRCGTIKNVEEFFLSKHVKTGRLNTCISCKREMGKAAKLRSSYGLTQEGLFKLLEEQNYKCSICFSSLGRKACIDHDHTTGKIRGILCDNCNRGLGLLKDSKEILYSAIRYLDNAGSSKTPLNGEHPEKDNPVLILLETEENA